MVPASLAARARDEFRRTVGSVDYPCLGARAALHTHGCHLEVYGAMASAETTHALSADLSAFVAEASGRTGFVAFAAIFLDVAPESELEFEQRLWRQLSDLADADACTEWAADASDDPDDPVFAFSHAAASLFVVGMHPESARLARRMTWPVLVFNPHAQFQRLRAEGRYAGLQRAIRERDRRLQGSTNPNLAERGERSEAGQYSGREVDERWRCPFHRKA